MLKTDKPTSLLQHKMLAGDRSGSKAGLTASERDFWSTPNNGHQQVGTVGPFRANTGNETLFDHLVGLGEKRRRDFNTKRFRCLEINVKQKLGGVLNWKKQNGRAHS